MEDEHEELVFLLGLLACWVKLSGPRQQLVEALAQRRLRPGHLEAMIDNLTAILEEARVQAQLGHHLA